MGDKRKLGKIAVDLTPILAGGGNGGIKPLSLHLLNGLARRGWNVTAFCRRSAHEELVNFFCGNVTLEIVDNADTLNISYQQIIKRDGEFDINFFPMQRVSIKRQNCSAISSIMDVQFADLPENFSSAEQAERDESFRTCVEKSDRIIAISRFTKSRISDLSDFPPKRIDVIPIAPPQAPVCDGDADEVLQRHSLKPDSYIIYPANFWVHKCHGELLEAYALYSQESASPAKLVFTGDANSELGRKITRRAAEIGNIAVTGYLPEHDVAALIANSRAIIFPSSYEGFGMPIIEAMVHGRPVAAAWCTALPEVTGGAALLFDNSSTASIAAAISRIVGDETLRNRLAARAEKRLIDLGNHSDMIDAYERAFASAISDFRANRVTAVAIHPDKWTSPKIHFEVPGAASGSELEVNVSVPPSAPSDAVTLAVETDGTPVKSAVLWRGGSYRVTHAFGPDGGSISFATADGSSPCDWFANDDTRERALRVGPVRLRRNGISMDALTGENLSVAGAVPRDAVIAIARPSSDGSTLVIAAPITKDSGNSLILSGSRVGEAIEFSPRLSPDDGSDGEMLEIWSNDTPDKVRISTESPEIVLLKFAATEIAAPVAIAPRSTLLPGFSVVIPSFEQGRFIGRTIESVLAQQGICEINVFDGGSQDETLDALASFGSAIRVESCLDGGQADAVNKGIAASRAEFIAWINSDDTYEPDAFAHVAELFALNPEVGVIYGDAFHIDEDDAIIERYPTEDFEIDRLFQRCYVCQPAAFIRRSVLERHGALRDSLHYCLDYELWLRLGIAGVPFLRTDAFLANSRFYAQTKTVASRAHAYFETADMMSQCFAYKRSDWQEHFVNAAVDHLRTHANSSPGAAARQARLLAARLWGNRPGD